MTIYRITFHDDTSTLVNSLASSNAIDHAILKARRPPTRRWWKPWCIERGTYTIDDVKTIENTETGRLIYAKYLS